MTGNFVAMFGLHPIMITTLYPGSFIEPHVPVYGHDYICMSSNIRSNSLSATCGERLQTTNLLSLLFQHRII